MATRPPRAVPALRWDGVCLRLRGRALSGQAALPLALPNVASRLVKRTVFAEGEVGLDGIDHQLHLAQRFDVGELPLRQTLHHLHLGRLHGVACILGWLNLRLKLRVMPANVVSAARSSQAAVSLFSFSKINLGLCIFIITSFL